MANKSTENEEAILKESEKAVKNKSDEPLYSVSDLARASKVFNTTPYVVATAMKLAGKTQATQSEALKIIKDFVNKEVK